MEGPPHYELVNGRLREKPEVAPWHDILLFNLVVVLATHFKRHDLGQLVGSTTPLQTSAMSAAGSRTCSLIPRDQYGRVGRNV